MSSSLNQEPKLSHQQFGLDRAVTAAVLEWYFAHLNALFASSLKQPSSNPSILSVTIQFSQPYT